MEQSLGPHIRWSPCDEAFQSRLAAVLISRAPQTFSELELSRCSRALLPFYRHIELVDVQVTSARFSGRAFLLFSDEHCLWLNGTSAAIHQANDVESPALTSATVLDYVRFFCMFVWGTDGPFDLVDAPDRLAATTAPAERLEQAAKAVSECPFTATEEDGGFRVTAAMAYNGTLFKTVFRVTVGADIQMIDDTSVLPLDGIEYPSNPPLVEEPEDPGPDASLPTTAMEPGSRSDRQTTEAVVSVLLTEAIEAQLAHTLLQRFNSKSDAAGAIAVLVRFAKEFTPVIIIESDIPFIEDIIAGIINPDRKLFAYSDIGRAYASGHDDGCCVVNFAEPKKLHLISFQAYRKLWDAEWTAHRLGLDSAVVLIGCDRLRDVPNHLQQVTDLVLRLPRTDGKLFPRIFKRTFGVAPPAGWDAPSADWPRYLQHTDFHAPIRLALSAEETVVYLRGRSQERLAQMSPGESPRLDELHGMGEAREIAEDLIADIAAARSGKIPWSAVDRGFLLVGAPGTGKTTLVRAIARSCDVKFLQASAAQWQSAGSLDSHLRAIRETFNEARRYAPAILFIDEIDSIGSRELATGHNALYHTEVINAVLEQMQGMDADEPVIVIAATNHASKVDPALRRAGRLDQTVSIPRPSIAALEEIFSFHLKPYRNDSLVGQDIDVRLLGQLAFGLTGADVEFFVRGAARRARKQGRKICQADLAAEVTQRPRQRDGLFRLSADDMRRVAVHEAGHALSAFLGGKDGTPPAYVSIIPRADGSLGFTATVPTDSMLLTRAQIDARLRTMLAGRAAEELVFGADDVSSGAGGGESSDLAAATRLAASVVCTTGLGPKSSLRWTAAPSVEQFPEVDQLLAQAYREILGVLKANRAALERISSELIAEQELTGQRIRELINDDRRPAFASQQPPAAIDESALAETDRRAGY
jgi:AAA+ superfamily predicted ATPase